jgi:hypothetical protein
VEPGHRITDARMMFIGGIAATVTPYGPLEAE